MPHCWNNLFESCVLLVVARYLVILAPVSCQGGRSIAGRGNPTTAFSVLTEHEHEQNVLGCGPTRENLGNCTAGGNAFVNSRHHPPGHLTYPEHAHKETSGAPAGNAPRKLKLMAKISQIAVENNAAPTGTTMRPIADNSGTVLSPTDMPAKHD